MGTCEPRHRERHLAPGRRPILPVVAFLAAALWTPGALAKNRPVVQVNPGDVADLYRKVSDPATAGSTLRLSGTYHLDTSVGDGFLDLGDRDLEGENEYQDVDRDGVWDEVEWPEEPGFPAQRAYARPRTETRVDGSALPLKLLRDDFGARDCNGNILNFMAKPVVYAGAGNRIERITISTSRGWPFKGNDSSAVIVAGGPSNRGRALVADSIIEGSDRGLNVANVGCEARGSMLKATVARNIIRGHALGLWAFNMMTQDATVDVLVKDNRITGNGRLPFDQGLPGFVLGSFSYTQDCVVRAVSTNNIIEGNARGAGIFHIDNVAPPWIVAILNPHDPPYVIIPPGNELLGPNRDRLDWTSQDDAFWNNTIAGGVAVMGSIHQYTANHGGDLQVSVRLLRPRFVKLKPDGTLDGPQNGAFGYGRLDVFAVGGMVQNPLWWAGLPDPAPYTNSTVELLVRGALSDGSPGTFVALDNYLVSGDPMTGLPVVAFPMEPSNHMLVIGNEVAFDRANANVAALLGIFSFSPGRPHP